MEIAFLLFSLQKDKSFNLISYVKDILLKLPLDAIGIDNSICSNPRPNPIQG